MSSRGGGITHSMNRTERLAIELGRNNRWQDKRKSDRFFMANEIPRGKPLRGKRVIIDPDEDKMREWYKKMLDQAPEEKSQ